MISNYLADANDISIDEYHPTKGVRIVEFESNELEINEVRLDAEIELWDCSGSQRYERCWPAILNNTDGVILVCRPDVDDGAALQLWYKNFVERPGIDISNVLVLLHTSNEVSNDSLVADFHLPAQMKGCRVFPANVHTEGDNLRLEFNSFLCRVLSNAELRQDHR